MNESSNPYLSCGSERTLVRRVNAKEMSCDSCVQCCAIRISYLLQPVAGSSSPICCLVCVEQSLEQQCSYDVRLWGVVFCSCVQVFDWSHFFHRSRLEKKLALTVHTPNTIFAHGTNPKNHLLSRKSLLRENICDVYKRSDSEKGGVLPWPMNVFASDHATQ